MNKQEIIKKLKQTISELSKNPAEKETVNALKKQLARMTVCIYGEYTNEPFNGCKTCGDPKTVICSNPKVIGKRRNSKGCNPANCKYFKSLT